MLYKTGIRLLGVARNPANGFPARLLVLVAIFVGMPLIAISCTVIFGLFDSSDPHDVPDSQISGRLTDSQYGQVADALTAQAVERNWCYKRDGSLDSRDGYILVVSSGLRPITSSGKIS